MIGIALVITITLIVVVVCGTIVIIGGRIGRGNSSITIVRMARV